MDQITQMVRDYQAAEQILVSYHRNEDDRFVTVSKRLLKKKKVEFKDAKYRNTLCSRPFGGGRGMRYKLPTEKYLLTFFFFRHFLLSPKCFYREPDSRKMVRKFSNNQKKKVSNIR